MGHLLPDLKSNTLGRHDSSDLRELEGGTVPRVAGSLGSWIQGWPLDILVKPSSDFSILIIHVRSVCLLALIAAFVFMRIKYAN